MTGIGQEVKGWSGATRLGTLSGARREGSKESLKTGNLSSRPKNCEDTEIKGNGTP